MAKFLRSIRFDDSDEHVFAKAAPPQEWCISGGGLFDGISKPELTGKLRQAFANGFLGIASLGYSTFASSATCSEDELEEIRLTLIRQFIEHKGAPDIEAAGLAADAEIAFVNALCADKPVNTVFTVHRRLNDKGEIEEECRIITPPRGDEPLHARIWEVEDETS